MGINNALLVSDNSLQQYLLDKSTGLPLSNGIVTFYVDDGGTTLKNIYKQTGTSGVYNYVLLPNPLVLGANGTFVDGSGNDIEIFYYPFDETAANQNNPPRQPYHVVVESALDILQFDRYNFPFGVGAGGGGSTTIPTNNNILVNNEFWRNGGTINTFNALDPAVEINGITGGISHTVVCPSQHDGYSMPDIQFLKDKVGDAGLDTITFKTFPIGTQALNGDVSPEYYLEFQCTNVGTSTFKSIQIPISLHLLTLGSYGLCSFSIQAKGISGNQTFGVSLLTYTGSGSTTSVTTPLTYNSNPLVPASNAWNKYVFDDFTFPPSLTPTPTGDDAFYLEIILPVGGGGICDLQFAKPEIYLAPSPAPNNDFSTYDAINAVISSPRLGDVRTSLNSFAPFGWVACNDGLISNSSIAFPATTPIARQNIDTWQLYNLLWSLPSIPIYNNTGVTTRGASAFADWGSKLLQLPLMLGRTLLGLPPAVNVSYTKAAPAWSSAVGTFALASGSTALFYTGSPVYLSVTSGGSLPAASPFALDTIYYAVIDPTLVDTTNIQLASSYSNALNGVIISDTTSTTVGSNIIVNFGLGANLGEKWHYQLNNETAQHAHLGVGGASYFYNGGSVTPNYNAGGLAFQLFNTTGYPQYLNYTSPGEIKSTVQQPSNIIQPSNYLNLFFKL